MKAMLVDEAQRLVWSDVADPVVGDGEVLIEIHCAALNRAAQSAAMGNTKELAAMLSSLMQSPEGMAVMSRISESAKK